jgi:hypothetical protein
LWRWPVEGEKEGRERRDMKSDREGKIERDRKKVRG